jgi:hypothetical protein
MITAQRQRRRRRAAAGTASVAIGLGLVGAMALPAAAEDTTAKYVDWADGTLTVNGASTRNANWSGKAGLMILDVAGQEEPSLAYCIQFGQGVSTRKPLVEHEWDDSVVNNRDKVERILVNYHPMGNGPAGYELKGAENIKAAATQAAIWHVTDGFELDTGDGENDADLVANYEAILGALAANALSGLDEGDVSLSIEAPGGTEGPQGELVGPFVVSTSAAEVQLSASDGLTLHNEDGTPFEGPGVDGSEIWLRSDGTTEGTLSATATGQQTGARVFVGENLQDMVFAVVTPVTAPAEVTVRFTSPATTTSSTTTSSTTTSSTTSTTAPQVVVGPTTTTTLPVTPAKPGGSLPVTGAQSALLVALALGLVAIGVIFGIVSRRSRGTR